MIVQVVEMDIETETALPPRDLSIDEEATAGQLREAVARLVSSLAMPFGGHVNCNRSILADSFQRTEFAWLCFVVAMQKFFLKTTRHS